MSKVTDHLYISGYSSAANRFLLSKLGISHIVNMAYEYRNAFPERYSYLHIPAKDVLSERLGPWFHEIAVFVADAKANGGRALVHCQLGISRSATAVLACLIINERMKLSDAFRLLKSAKADVEPNTTFLRELRVLEQSVFGCHCKEKLTPLDRCEDAGPLDWKESVAIIAAAAALSGASFDAFGAESQCIHAAFQDSIAESTDAAVHLLSDILIFTLESFGGRNERDVRARAAVKDLLTGLPRSSFCTPTRLRDMLQAASESAEFQDMKIDLPRADEWLDDLLQGIEDEKHT